MEAKTFTPTARMAEVNRLIDGLLAEPFAVSQNIEDATLESIQTSFEEIDEAYADGLPPPELTELKDSYERSKETFCLILMELEAMGATGQETLHDLRYRDSGTQILSRPIERGELSPSPSAPPQLTLVPPLEEEPAEERAEEQEDIWNTHLEANSRLNAKKVSKPLPPPPPELTPPPAVQVFEPVQVPAAPPESIIETPAFIEVAPASAEPEPALDPMTEEYWERAEEIRKGPPSESARRLEAQCRIFAVECELWSQMREAVQVFWPHKESVIRDLSDPTTKSFELHPIVRAGLQLLAGRGREFLPDASFPYTSVRNAVRFLLSSPLWDEFVPLPVEIGALILFFGGERAMQGLILHNHLGLGGITEEEALELTFRLFRCQVARNRVLAPSGNGTDLDLVREDCERLIKLASKLRLGKR